MGTPPESLPTPAENLGILTSLEISAANDSGDIDPGPGLSEHAASAAYWNYVGSISKTFLQLATTIVLARILGPEPFGIIAVAYIALGFGSLFSDAGFGAALVQRATVTARDVRFVFTCQLAVGLFLTVGLMVLSHPIGNAFGPGVATVLFFLAPLFTIQAGGMTGQSLLRRRMEFRTAQASQLGSYVVGYVLVGVPAAVLGAGVWSLVAAQLIQASTYSGIMIFVTRHDVRPALRPTSPGLLKFGGSVVATNIVNYGILNADNVAAGHYLGLSTLGVYGRAYNTITMPVQTLVLSLQSVLFSTASRAQETVNRVAKAYLICIELIALFIVPMFLCVALLSKEIVATLYGSQWTGAVPILRWLALGMVLYSLLAPAGPILWSRGRVGTELRLEIVVLVSMALMLVSVGHGSITAVAQVVVGAYALRLMLSTRAALRSVQVCWRELRTRLTSPALVNLVVFAVVCLVYRLISPLRHDQLRLILCGTSAVGAFHAIFRVRRYDSVLSGDSRSFIQVALSGLPRRLTEPTRWLLCMPDRRRRASTLAPLRSHSLVAHRRNLRRGGKRLP